MFKVGDKVDWLGSKGEIIGEEFLGNDSIATLIKVSFESGEIVSFFCDGKFRKDQNPSLKLIERPKKKVMKRYWLWDAEANGGFIVKNNIYMDEKGYRTDGSPNKDPRNLIKKHEQDFLDLEVEEEG